jgi:hypothetical protein
METKQVDEVFKRRLKLVVLLKKYDDGLTTLELSKLSGNDFLTTKNDVLKLEKDGYVTSIKRPKLREVDPNGNISHRGGQRERKWKAVK